jgi:hypothetical protein
VEVSLAIGGVACALLGLIAFWWLRRIPVPPALREVMTPTAPA